MASRATKQTGTMTSPQTGSSNTAMENMLAPVELTIGRDYIINQAGPDVDAQATLTRFSNLCSQEFAASHRNIPLNLVLTEGNAAPSASWSEEGPFQPISLTPDEVTRSATAMVERILSGEDGTDFRVAIGSKT